MKKSFKMSVKIKGCDVVFDEKLGPGIIALNVVELKPKRGRTDRFDMDLAVALHDYKQKLLEEVVEVITEEIE